MIDVFLVMDKDGVVVSNHLTERLANMYLEGKKNLSIQRIQVKVPIIGVSGAAISGWNEIKLIKDVIYEYYEKALMLNDGNIAKTARDLGMSDTNFRHHLKKMLKEKDESKR